MINGHDKTSAVKVTWFPQSFPYLDQVLQVFPTFSWLYLLFPPEGLHSKRIYARSNWWECKKKKFRDDHLTVWHGHFFHRVSFWRRKTHNLCFPLSPRQHVQEANFVYTVYFMELKIAYWAQKGLLAFNWLIGLKSLVDSSGDSTDHWTKRSSLGTKMLIGLQRVHLANWAQKG